MNQPNRNFGSISSKISQMLKQRNDEELTEETIKVLESSRRWSPWLTSQIINQLKLIEAGRMSAEDYGEFTHGLKRINRDVMYIPPEGMTVVWEKLAKLCRAYLNPYADQRWALDISRLIRGI